MVKNSLMPGRLVFLSICVYFQLCYCVRSGTWSFFSVDLRRSTLEELQSLSGPSTSGQDATRSPCNQTNLEERQENNIQNTEEVKIGLQLRWGEEEAKPLKAKRKCRPKHFKDGEMRGGKFPKLSNGTTDDNGQYIGSSSSNGTTLNGTRVSHDGQRDKRSDGQESCGKDDRAAESLGASPPNCIFVCESTRSDVPNSTSQSSIAVARKFTSTGTYANSVCSSTLSGVGNEETSLSPVCSEVNSASERRMTSEEFYSRLFGPWEEIMKCNKEGRESEKQEKEVDREKDEPGENLGASPPNCSFVYESTRSDFAPRFHPGFSMCSAQRHVLSDGNSAVMDDQRFHNHNLNLESNSSEFGCREKVEGSRAANCMVVGSRDFHHPFTFSTSTVSFTMGVSNSTSQSSVAIERNCTSTGTNTYANSVFFPTLAGGGNEETSLSPVCSKVRESEEQGKEEESGKDDEMESQKACKHYNRRCEVWFPCCRQFYRCHECHNSASNCENDEAKACDATHLKCSRCQFTQEIKENSDVCSRCGVKMAEYFCFPCKSFKGVHEKPYHCDLCGICRTNKDKMYHCEGCSVCIKKKLKNCHKCLPNSDHRCCICLESVFKSCHPLKCGHKVHPKCAVAYILRKWTTCPLCRQPLRRFNA